MKKTGSGRYPRWLQISVCVLRWGGLLILFAVFLTAGAAKAMRPDLFALDIMNFDFVPWSVGVGLAYGLPWIELLAAVGLLIPKTRSVALGVVIGLLVSFTMLLGWTLARGLEVSCGCLGAGEGDLSSALWRNGILMAIACALIWSEHNQSPTSKAEITDSSATDCI